MLPHHLSRLLTPAPAEVPVLRASKDNATDRDLLDLFHQKHDRSSISDANDHDLVWEGTASILYSKVEGKVLASATATQLGKLLIVDRVTLLEPDRHSERGLMFLKQLVATLKADGKPFLISAPKLPMVSITALVGGGELTLRSTSYRISSQELNAFLEQKNDRAKFDRTMLPATQANLNALRRVFPNAEMLFCATLKSTERLCDGLHIAQVTNQSGALIGYMVGEIFERDRILQVRELQLPNDRTRKPAFRELLNTFKGFVDGGTIAHIQLDVSPEHKQLQHFIAANLNWNPIGHILLGSRLNPAELTGLELPPVELTDLPEGELQVGPHVTVPAQSGTLDRRQLLRPGCSPPSAIVTNFKDRISYTTVFDQHSGTLHTDTVFLESPTATSIGKLLKVLEGAAAGFSNSPAPRLISIEATVRDRVVRDCLEKQGFKETRSYLVLPPDKVVSTNSKPTAWACVDPQDLAEVLAAETSTTRHFGVSPMSFSDYQKFLQEGGSELLSCNVSGKKVFALVEPTNNGVTFHRIFSSAYGVAPIDYGELLKVLFEWGTAHGKTGGQLPWFFELPWHDPTMAARLKQNGAMQRFVFEKVLTSESRLIRPVAA